jgi:hypothetical protein
MSEMAPIPTEFCAPQRKSLSAMSGLMHRSKTGPYSMTSSAQHNRWGYRKTERLGGLEVQDHLELGRKLNGQFRRLCAAGPRCLEGISGGTSAPSGAVWAPFGA